MKFGLKIFIIKYSYLTPKTKIYFSGKSKVFSKNFLKYLIFIFEILQLYSQHFIIRRSDICVLGSGRLCTESLTIKNIKEDCQTQFVTSWNLFKFLIRIWFYKKKKKIYLLFSILNAIEHLYVYNCPDLWTVTYHDSRIL